MYHSYIPVCLMNPYQCLDTGAEFGPQFEKGGTQMSVAFAACLLEFLDSLPEPVIPVNMHARCAQVVSRDQAFEVSILLVFVLHDKLKTSLSMYSCWMTSRAHLST